MRPRSILPVLLGLALALPVASVPSSAGAQPPPWAPAHGWRAKHGDHAGPGRHGPGRRHRQDDARVYAPEDFGIHHGHCERDLLGEILRDAVRGVIGTGIGDGPGGELVADGVTEMLIGGRVGGRMDVTDQYCVAQALERADDQAVVRWHDPDAGRDYTFRPHAGREEHGRLCRDYEVVLRDRDGRPMRERATACRDADGRWWPR